MRLLQLKISCEIFHNAEPGVSKRAATAKASINGAGSWVRIKRAPALAASNSAASVAAPASPGARPVTTRRKDLRETEMKTGKANRDSISPKRASTSKEVSGRGPRKKPIPGSRKIGRASCRERV